MVELGTEGLNKAIFCSEPSMEEISGLLFHYQSQKLDGQKTDAAVLLGFFQALAINIP